VREWLESLLPWGIEAIVWVQAHSNAWLDRASLLLSALGYEEAYLVLLPLVYWCIDKGIGISLGCISMFSAWASYALKHSFAIPRPADPRIRVARLEPDPAFPSGHAQNAVANWGYLALRCPLWVFRVVAVMIIAGVGASRVVLGVHYPQDVVAGWLVGVLLLAGYAGIAPAAVRWMRRQSMVRQLSVTLVVPLVLIFLHPASAEGCYPALDAIAPAGALIGLGVGAVMESAWVQFRVDGPLWRRPIRFLLGLTLVLIFYVGPKLLLPAGLPHTAQSALRLSRYALIGWVVFFLCPWVFVRVGLAQRRGRARP